MVREAQYLAVDSAEFMNGIVSRKSGAGDDNKQGG
jgi:hypothetical protein